MRILATAVVLTAFLNCVMLAQKDTISKNSIKADTVLKDFGAIGGSFGFGPPNTYAFYLRFLNFGFTIGGDGTAESIPEYYKYSIPHNDYYLRMYHKGTLYANVFYSQPVTEKISIAGGVSYHVTTDSAIAISNTTGWRYAHSSHESNSKFSFVAGVLIYPIRWLELQAMYDPYRKYTLGVAYRLQLPDIVKQY